MSEEIRQIPEEFKKVVPDFINDIKTTFPEYVPIINQWWVSNTFDEPEMTAKIEKVFNHCLGIFPERFFDILYKNAEMFDKDSDVNTEFLPGLSFKYLWNFDISDNTKETIWKYLQLISISIIGCVKDQSAFGDSAKLFESLNEDDFKGKLEETLEKMQNMFENNSGDEGSESSGNDKTNMPSVDDIHNHISGMLGGKLGDLAREIAEETAGNLDMDFENVTDVKDVFQKMFKNPGKLMSIVKNVGDKLDSKMKSGEINQTELMSEASEIMNKMKNMPGMQDIQSMLGKMGGLGGLGGLGGKNVKLNTGAMQSKMDQTMKMMNNNERMKKNLEMRKQAKLAAENTRIVQDKPQLTEKEIEDLINSIQQKTDKPEKTPRVASSGGKTGGDGGKKKKKGKK
jgi:hypothetical protein